MDEDLKSVAGRSERSEGANTASTALCQNSAAGTVVDGQVFLKVRSCIACGRKNCDLNEIRAGLLSKSRFTVWHRGTPEDPQSKHDRVCQLTYQHGAFGDESIEEFVNNRMKRDPQLQAEFIAARGAMLELLNEGKARFRGKTMDSAKQRLELARKKSVEEFKEASTEVVTGYVCWDRALFEKEHPGLIEKKGLKVAKKVIDGKKREVVMIRKNREGIWDVNVTEKTGVRQMEEIDNGEHEIHEGQHSLKFSSSKKRLHNALAEKANESSVLAADSQEDLKDKALPRLAESSDEDGDYGVRSTLLDEGDSPPRKTQRPNPSSGSGANLPAPKNKARGGQQAQNPIPAGSKFPDSAVSKHLSSERRESREQPPGPTDNKADTAGRGRPNKFNNKTPVEVLESSGLVEVKTCRQSVQLASNNFFCSESWNVETTEVYKKTMAEFSGKTSEYQRKATALEAKVKKWQNRPSETDELAGRQKELASMLHAAATVFQLSAKRSPNTDKMEQILTTLRHEGLEAGLKIREVPMAWCDLLLQEKLAECLRFKKLDEFARTCQPGKGPFEGVADERADVMQACIHKCLGQILCDLVPDPAVSQKKNKKGAATAKERNAQIQTMLDLALRLVEENALPEEMLRDLDILADALDEKRADHATAHNRLSAWKQDDEYFGVLRPVVRNEHWSALVQQFSAPASAASTSACLRSAFNKVNGNTSPVSEQDRGELVGALQGSAEQPADYDYLNSVLCGLQLLAEEANKQQKDFVLRVCKDICGRGVSASDFHGDEDLMEQMFAKGHWEVSVVKNAISESAAEQQHKNTVLQTCEKLAAASSKVCLWHGLLNAILTLAKTAQEHADNGLDANVQDDLVQCWSEVKHRLQTDPEIAAAAQPVKEALENLLNATKTEQVGPQVYEGAMTELRLSAMELLRLAKERRKPEVQEAASNLRKLEHRCMQCCSLSDTPVFARSCVSLVTTEFAGVCEVLPSAASEQIPDDILNSSVMQHLRAANDKETNKQKLVHVLHSSGCEQFLEQASKLLERLEPLFTAKKVSLEKLLVEAAASAKAKLVNPHMGMDEFLQSAASGEALKKALKQLRAAERDMQGHGMLQDGSELQRDVSEVKASCRLQIIKWGIVTLVANADIAADNSKGKGLRKTLRDVWNSHCDDGDVKSVLGQAVVDLVEQSLATPEKTEDPGAVAPKKRGKKK
ncbi:ANKRD50 [Symbiodinium sp. CCMP2592]|nr:ANKRD50 [Symbiodinium sp. CCMP2592]